jgi:hypothetical protein
MIVREASSPVERRARNGWPEMSILETTETTARVEELMGLY